MDASTFNSMSKGQQIAAGGGAAAVVATFLPWYSISSGFGGFSLSGTDFGFGWMGMILVAAGAGLTAAPAFGKTVGNEQVKGEQLALVLAGIGAAMWLYRLASAPFGVSRGVGLYLAIAAAAAVISGVVMHMKEHGIAIPNAETFTAAKSAMSGSAQATPTDQASPPREF